MSENFANRYQTTLAAGVAAGDLTGTIASATGAPTAPFRAIISAEGANTDEIVLVTNRVGTTLTWTRAAEAIAGVQAASAHASGATFTAILTAAGIADIIASGGGGHDPVTVGTGLDVTGQLVELDLSEVAAGGELAGFMDAPTVDATHSGSTHAATQAAAEGTAAAALSGHVGAADPHTGYLKEADVANFTGSTLLVAASNAGAKAIAAADYVCDGTADDVQIAAAIAALPNSVGTVQLSGGTFTIAATVNVPDGVTLRGMGRGATTITGVAGMTASMLTTGDLLSGIENLKVLIPTSLTSDAIVWAVESIGNHMRDMDIVAPTGSSASIWALFIPSAYEFHLQRIKVDTYTKGVRIANTNGLYNTGDAYLADVFIRVRAASTTALEVAGYEGTPAKSQNSITFIRVTAAGMAEASQVGLHIKNSHRLVFDALNVEGVTTSIEIAGLVGGGGTSASIVFIGTYATGAINLDANTYTVSFVGGRLTGTITDSQATAVSKARFYAGASANGTTPIAEPWEASIPTLPLNGYIGPQPIRSVTTTAWPVANKAWYFAFQVNRAVTVTKAIIGITTVHAGHADIGIYSAAGARLASTGSTDLSALGNYAQPQIALSASVALVPGTLYWAGLAMDTNTDRLMALTSLATGEADTAGNVAKAQATAFPLPDPATFATGTCITPYIEFIA